MVLNIKALNLYHDAVLQSRAYFCLLYGLLL